MLVGRDHKRMYQIQHGGLSDTKTCPTYGKIWVTPHRWRGTSGVTHFLDGFQNLTYHRVEWRPYVGFNTPCFQTHTDIDIGRHLIHTLLIHFWIVEWKYPERVMRQFDLFQHYPVLLLILATDTKKLHSVDNYKKQIDWGIHHCDLVLQSKMPLQGNFITEQRSFCGKGRRNE